MDVPATSDRISQHTADEANRRIADLTRCRIQHYAKHPDEIDQRLQQLDEEWDIERALEANASALALAGLVFGTTVHRRCLLFSGTVMAFLLQHALQGWCPPLPLFRRMGVRTQSEIDAERYALRLIRGDFNEVIGSKGQVQVEKLLAAIKVT